jgi:thiamine pyrophosphokinase
MKKCVIFCAADFDSLLSPLEADDLVIAADGGLRHTDALQIEPDVILGDFDSLGYIPKDSRVFPVEKDDTDMMLAIRLGLQRGCRAFYLYGAMDGPRLDHTVANLQSLGYLAEHGAYGYLIGRDYIATCLKGETLVFSDRAEGIVSVFCQGADARGVTLEGLQYPMENGTLTAHFPLGVSNHFIGRQARIRVKEGILLCLWDRSNGLCNRE